MAVDAASGPRLEEICRNAVGDLGFRGAVVTLIAASGSQAVAAASDESIRHVEELQFDLGEGPSMTAFAAGRPVLIADLGKPDSDLLAYAAAAQRLGIGSVFAFPIQVGGARLGVFTLYGDHPRSLDRRELNACLVLNDRAVDALLGGGPAEQHPAAMPATLRFRSEVYQAQGMVMVDLGVGLPEALSRMRAHAFAAEMNLTDVAREILAGRKRLNGGEGM